MSGNGGWKAGQVADMLRDAELDAISRLSSPMMRRSEML